MAEQYIVRVVRFKCIDESGIDWPGSDEPYWIFTNVMDNNTPTNRETFRSNVFKNVHTGTTREFDMGSGSGKNVVWPRQGATLGAQGPIGLSIQLWEQDQGNPDRIKQLTKAAFDAAGQLPTVGSFINRVPDRIGEDIITKFLSDDIMGSVSITYSVIVLKRRLRSVNDSFFETYRFSSRGELPFNIGGSPDYDLTLEVKRLV